MASGFDRFRNGIGLIVAVALALPLFDPAMSWFMVPATVGGILMAGALFYVHRTHLLDRLEEATDVSDSVTRGMFNLATINPAGIGGLGLVFMAAIVAAQYREIQLVLSFGLTGGIVIAALLIPYRRSHTSTPHPLQLLTTRR